MRFRNEAGHALRNQVAIVVGYCELLLDEVPADSPLRPDIVELHKAALAAMRMLQEDEQGS